MRTRTYIAVVVPQRRARFARVASPRIVFFFSQTETLIINNHGPRVTITATADNRVYASISLERVYMCVVCYVCVCA